VITVTEYVKIPKNRLELLLADNSKVKKLIESSTQTKLEIDEELCQVTILETEKMPDPLATWRARDIVKAIGRGFDQEIALDLLGEDTELKIIDLKEFIGKSKNAAIRIKGRIIGREGKSKTRIEDLTNTHIVIYGKTVSIIGSTNGVHIATKAISILASGAMHSTIFKMIENEVMRNDAARSKR